MNVKRFVAPDMRRAILHVRTEHGPDAVILSSRSVEGGVEIIAAGDYDETLLERMSVRLPSAPSEAQPEPGLDEPRARNARADVPNTETSVDPALREVHRDVLSLKAMLREQLTRSALRPGYDVYRAALAARGGQLGLDADLVATLVGEVSCPEQPDKAWREVMFGLARRIQVLRRDPLEEGGVLALLGPTGVGKTTTIAKLAARHCLEHGRDSLALITTDSFRIGGHRQLEAFGAILGVPVRRAETAKDMASLIREYSRRRLVLIDTAGLAPRDERVGACLGQLETVDGIRRFLVLAASMQGSVMRDATRMFGKGIAGVVLTKIDEANGLGAALSVLVEERLPAAWLSEGQRVPEDLCVARVAKLIRWAAGPPSGPAAPAEPMPLHVPGFDLGRAEHAAA